MDVEGRAPGAVGLQLVSDLPLLRPEEQVFSAMLQGWRAQQMARNLSVGTAEGRERTVQAFGALICDRRAT